ncbi:thioredoxin [Streptomyces sp. NPDC048590]|uniref:thioredoxin n=1 Tax=Streptomyces sp. NPDC048590 TaxID=3365574 RepID=UPI003722B2C1
MTDLTESTIDAEVASSALPLLIHFWAEWAGPCKMTEPILDELAVEYDGRLRLARLNIDQNPDTPPRYDIKGIPTLLLFERGELVGTKIGAQSKGQLTEFLDERL